jgi:hypothetical protein
MKPADSHGGSIFGERLRLLVAPFPRLPVRPLPIDWTNDNLSEKYPEVMRRKEECNLIAVHLAGLLALRGRAILIVVHLLCPPSPVESLRH